MAKYKVLVSGKFAEGWGEGDIIDLDEAAAEAAVEKGILELADTPKKKVVKKKK